MMQAFRSAAKPVMILITVTFLAWIIVDLSGITGNGGVLTKTNVGSINGTAVDVRVYQQAVQQAITQRQQETGKSLGLEETEQVRNEVWDQFVQNVVISDQIEKRNLGVTTDEIADAIRNVPPQEVRTLPDFQTAGSFDLRKYQAWLASPVGQQAVPVLEARYREEILQAKLLRNVTADIFLSDASLWERYRDQHEQVKISLTAIIARNAVPDSAVTVTPADLEAYYTAHKAEFKRPRTAYLSSIAVPRRIDASDTAAALVRAKAVRAELVGGTPFAELAKRESSDTVSARNGGDLGEFAKGTMVPAFDKAAFALPLNTISEPVLCGLRLSHHRSHQAEWRQGHGAAHLDPDRIGWRPSRPGRPAGRFAGAAGCRTPRPGRPGHRSASAEAAHRPDRPGSGRHSRPPRHRRHPGCWRLGVPGQGRRDVTGH